MQVLAKVAVVISDHQLAINAGSTENVEVGDTVTVFKDIVIPDPESGEQLGIVRLNRLRLRVVHVQDHLCVARVTEYAGGDDLFLTFGKRRKLKMIAQFPSSDDDAVHVEIGESVVIRKPDSGEPATSTDDQ